MGTRLFSLHCVLGPGRLGVPWLLLICSVSRCAATLCSAVLLFLSLLRVPCPDLLIAALEQKWNSP